jgi:hypothetical protein
VLPPRKLRRQGFQHDFDVADDAHRDADVLADLGRVDVDLQNLPVPREFQLVTDRTVEKRVPTAINRSLSYRAFVAP